MPRDALLLYITAFLPVGGRQVGRARPAGRRPRFGLLLLGGGEGQRAGRLEHGVAR